MTYDQESWVRQFKLHSWSHGALAAFVPLLTHAAMAADGRGSVILVGSVSGDIWNPIAMQDGMRHARYTASKAGDHLLGKLLAAKLVNVGIRVNAVSPRTFPSRINDVTSQARPAEYPRLFLDTRSSGNLAAAHTQSPDVHVAISPSLLTVGPSFDSPGPSGQAIASGQGKAKGASGRRGRKRKAIDHDAPEEGPAPLPAQPHPYPQPTPGYVYVPVESLGQQQAGPAAYLPSYGNFTGAPGLMSGALASASAPSFAMYPSQPAYGLSASDIQTSTQSPPSRSGLPASGRLRRSPRLASRRQSEDGEEASEGDGSPFPQPASSVPSHPAPSVPLSERDVVRRKKKEELAQKQRDQKVDRFLVLNNLLEDYRVVIVSKNGKKWTPQQQILQNAIAYVQNLQNVRNEMNAKLEQSEALCAQERANAASLWDTAEDYRLQLEAERKESESWKTKKESMEHELAQLKRKVDDARCSVCDSALTSAT
ncbi:hypothetical protein EWM64_g9829 [Hericium alpestre]|uniref:BHLH domain-containing protein n=1 Tax=Hericium alpestre TaxID=135208 RepID=A0A4Y9ZJW5_9AGAM|nr:hypothetical protein EWM64_g9829 [Hericium alpestre]